MSPRRGAIGIVVLLLIVAFTPLCAQGNGEAALSTRNVVQAIPAGTTIEARLERAIDAAQSRIGDRFTARVTEPSVSAGKRLQVPANAIITGTIAGLQRAHTKFTPAYVRVIVESVSIDGQTQPMHATVEGTSLPIDTAQQGGTAVRRSPFPRAARGSILAGVNASGAMKGSLISLGTDESAMRLPRGTLLKLRTQ